MINENTPQARGCQGIRAAIAEWHRTGGSNGDLLTEAFLEAIGNEAMALTLLRSPLPDSTSEEGDEIAIDGVLVEDDEGSTLMPAFTDDAEMHKAPATDLYPAAMPVRDMFTLAMACKDVDGVIFNPSGENITVRREILEWLLEETRPRTQDEIDLDNGADAYNKGDFETAYALYKKSAEAGNVTALSNLGYCYYYGRSIPVDKTKAHECWEKAAVLGDICATYKLGDMYNNGDLPADPVFAHAMYLKAFHMAAEDKNPYDYPDASLRILKFCREDFQPEELYNIAGDAVDGFRQRMMEGETFSRGLLAQAEEILAELAPPTFE